MGKFEKVLSKSIIIFHSDVIQNLVQLRRSEVVSCSQDSPQDPHVPTGNLPGIAAQAAIPRKQE